MTELESALLEVASLIERLSIPYMLIGGLAVAAWGEPRATLDVDLSLWVEPDRLDQTVTDLSMALRPLPQNPTNFVRSSRVLPVLANSGVRIDLVFASLPMEADLINRAKPIEVAGKVIPVASVEDIIWMKLISERKKDLEDAQGLLRRHRHSVDRKYLESRLSELAEALARPDVLDVLQRELDA
ncbi:MAG: nucleotidyl transferase AbiEii/AbiGii toxin family protein [Bryobacteraceae bacterium]